MEGGLRQKKSVKHWDIASRGKRAKRGLAAEEEKYHKAEGNLTQDGRDMGAEELLQAVRSFRAWQAERFPGRGTYDIGGEWETWYDGWTEIGTAFGKVLREMNAEEADVFLLDEMVYIIARDNECETLMEELAEYPEWFGRLCRHSLHGEEQDAKWQFAAYLPECGCGGEVKDLILAFAEDSYEYVCRRALLAMPRIRPDKVEYYAEQFWNRNLYAPAMQEYQRIAALNALNEIKSPLLKGYLRKAGEDGREYLSQCAKKIEEENRQPAARHLTSTD